jgi:8-oxo-dGTP diphosphatase
MRTDASPAYGADPSRYQYIPRVLVFVTNGDRILMLRRAAHKQFWPGLLNAPGGHVERGEDPYAAAQREVQEETGVQVTSLRLRGMIVAETGLAGSGILVLVYQGQTAMVELIGGPEGEPCWVRRDELAGDDLVPDLSQLCELVFDQADFFYLTKTPVADQGEMVDVRLVGE